MDYIEGQLIAESMLQMTKHLNMGEEILMD